MITTTSGFLATVAQDTTLVVGVEDELVDGCLKVYVGMRSRGFYVLIQDPEAQRDVRSAWGGGGHVLIPPPPQGHLYRDGEVES